MHTQKFYDGHRPGSNVTTIKLMSITEKNGNKPPITVNVKS